MLGAGELVVVEFAGGGGSSDGIKRAIGRDPDIAVNHDPEAIAMHTANHPNSEHHCQNVWLADPREICRGRPVGAAWFSPDCKHFSKAKGGKPVDRNIRALAWVVIKWAKHKRPRVIFLENVEEFQDWGPLIKRPDGKWYPDPARKGVTFRRWVAELQALGYVVEWRELRACDYGAPTIRKRLFLIARCDGEPIIWPVPTHGPGRALPWHTAAECIDWSIPCRSIFGRKKPLAEATMARIARGVQRFVIDAANPFIVPITHNGDARVHGIEEPLRTVTTSTRGELALVEPFITKFRASATGQALDEPLHTVTANSYVKRPGGAAPLGLVAPVLIPRYGERPGQDPRCRPADAPMPTIVPTGNHASLVTAFLAQHNTGMTGHDARGPVSTIVQKGCTQALVSSHLIKLKGTCKDGQAVSAPMPTVQAEGTHIGEVRAFLVKYHRDGGQLQDCREPLHTVDSRGRFGLVTIRGEDYQIVDIGMRMLVARELFRAQSFRDSYVIDPMVRGPRGVMRPLTATAQIRMCGNAVNPVMAEALFRAQFGLAPAESEAA